MHELTLIHTDLKPENILLVSSEYVKVPDYKVSSYANVRFITLGICHCNGTSDLTFDVNLKFARSFS